MPLGGTPETNVGEKLALSLDSVAIKSTEPAEAAANAAAAVGQAAPSVEAATAAEAVGKVEPAAAAVNAAEAVGQTELERAEPATTAVKAAGVVGQTEPPVAAVNTADMGGQQGSAAPTVVVLQAETRNTRLLRNVARKLGNAPTSRAKLLHKLKVPDLVPLAAAKATMPVAGDPTLTLLTPKPKQAWELGRGPKITPSPNQPG